MHVILAHITWEEISVRSHVYILICVKKPYMYITVAYQVATLVKHKSQKAMMAAGRDPREGILPSLGLIVSWLLVVACRITLFFFYLDHVLHYFLLFLFYQFADVHCNLVTSLFVQVLEKHMPRGWFGLDRDGDPVIYEFFGHADSKGEVDG